MKQLAGTQQPKGLQHWWSWKLKLSEAMEKNFRLASRIFWQTIRQLKKGKQGPSQVLLGLYKKLLTCIEDIIEEWKRHFLDDLNLTSMSL